eukprot:COSAG06_NODE_457_length_15473_cov_68.819240_6_plen_89_part_00
MRCVPFGAVLYYIDPSTPWDENPIVIETVLRIIKRFGPRRCFFASNYPVDVNKGWPADRLFGAFRRLCDDAGETQIQILWGDPVCNLN